MHSSVGEKLVQGPRRDQAPRVPSSYRLTSCTSGQGPSADISTLCPGWLAAASAAGRCRRARWFLPISKSVVDYCCFGRSAAHRGLHELLMIPPTATAHHYAAAGHSPSRVTPTLNTNKSDLQRKRTLSGPDLQVLWVNFFTSANASIAEGRAVRGRPPALL